MTHRKNKKHTKSKPKPKPTVNCKNCSYVYAYHCALYNTAQNSSDNLSSYPPDNREYSDLVYCRGGGRPIATLVLFHLVHQ